jgi:hypothetical protein
MKFVSYFVAIMSIVAATACAIIICTLVSDAIMGRVVDLFYATFIPSAMLVFFGMFDLALKQQELSEKLDAIGI